ncbi:hypothetical protein [Pseudomonas sp. NY15354]|uniref:hypothetical protein n=1 Tax=Pseudomonas sp. NY15354 TaxID=3400351 RepID=UPI003A876A80
MGSSSNYSDSCIRAAYKDRWKHDLLRVKGGNHDYCITSEGEIDVQALRQFQSSYRPPDKDFKPVQGGLKQGMAHARRALSKGEQA